MDERELVGLLYRADWTRLALTGTVRGGDTGLPMIVAEKRRRGAVLVDGAVRPAVAALPAVRRATPRPTATPSGR